MIECVRRPTDHGDPMSVIVMYFVRCDRCGYEGEEPTGDHPASSSRPPRGFKQPEGGGRDDYVCEYDDDCNPEETP